MFAPPFLDASTAFAAGAESDLSAAASLFLRSAVEGAAVPSALFSPPSFLLPLPPPFLFLSASSVGFSVSGTTTGSLNL